ncbi:MAG: asparagine synthase (glutamine-hydrolyzing) [Planctomycetota bacterium]
MCGIVGAYQPGSRGVSSLDVVARMRDQMLHRGPDGAGLWRDPQQTCAFGHRRLSIIDLSDAAAQPMANADASVILVFNGEIYNHAALREQLSALGKYTWQTDHSDTEVLLHVYEEWGLAGIERLIGMFAFAIFDRRDPARPALHLVRDRVGVKPLYITRTSHGEWLFASEIRALLAHPEVPREMDPVAFWHYLTFIVAPAPLTMFRGVFKVPAGHGVTIDHLGQARAWRYWDCVVDPSSRWRERDLSIADATQELTRLLRQSIARRMVADVPFGVLLSGGVDSSLNVALMSELMTRPVSTFTIGYEGEEETNEYRFARQIAARYGTDHHESIIDRPKVQEFLPQLVRLQDEPIADNVCIPLYFLAESVRRGGCTVVQVGEGADENFLGYWWCQHYLEKYQQVYQPARRGVGGWRQLRDRLLAKHRPMSQEDLETRRRAERGAPLFWGGAVCWWGDLRAQLTPSTQPFRGAVECPIAGLLPEAHQGLESGAIVARHLEELGSRLPEPAVLHQIPYLEMKLRLPEHLLMRVDKLTMAHSVEARVPFLDHELVEFAMRLPASYKLRDGVGKWLLKRAAEAYLPTELVYRKKQGFGAPMETWFRNEDFAKRCFAALDRSRLAREGYFDAGYVRGMLDRQVSGAGGYSFHLWTVLNAVLWHESWIEGREDCF